MKMIGLFDIHCHIIPAVDDGARNIEESMQMIGIEYNDGVRNIIATPHYRKGMFETSNDIILSQFNLLKKRVEESGMDMNLYLGCEFHCNIDMVVSLNQKMHGHTMAGSKYVLTEFRDNVEKRYMQEHLNMIRTAGYRPIIAHLERYYDIRKDMNFIEEIVEMGAKIQVNTRSIIGGNGFAVKRFCTKLMKNDLLSFVGTDGHGCQERIPLMREAYLYVKKKFGADYANEIFIDNPRNIVKPK